MPYLGNIPATQFAELKYQDFTGGTGTSFTLNDPVGSAQELEVFVNNVRQEPGVAYTVSGTTLTMTGSIVATDDFYVVFQGKSTGTATHPAGQALTATDGTFTGDLTVDTNTLHVDAANNRVGIGTATPDSDLKIKSTGAATLRLDGGAVASSVGPLIVGEHNDTDAFYIGTNSVVLGESSNQDVVIYGADSSSGNIRFYAGASTETARIRDGGGITFNGDTAAANALDDYEEGTFTPALNGEGACTITTSSATGYYTKVGRFVHVNMFFQLSAVSGGSSSLAVELANLPFNTNSAQNVAGSVRVANLGSSVEGVQVIVFNNSDGGRIEEFTGIGGTNLSDHLASNTNFQVTLGYST